jgi:D-alanyl-D-alanine carboxypeptidase (penicillin-binding protein 5/6)
MRDHTRRHAPALVSKLRVVALVACLGLAGTAWAKPHHAHAPRDPNRNPYPLAAQAFATVVDGDLLWGRNVDAHRAPASLTKLLTALVLLDSDTWNPDAIMTVSRDAAHTTPSRVGLHTGDRVRAADALSAMLMHSANDACLTLVENSAASVPAFVERMNARAVALGMHDSHFVHPCGYDEPGQYSTVNDLLRLAKAAHANQQIATVVSQEQGSLVAQNQAGTRERHLSFKSTNHLLGEMPGVLGLKTGYTAQAGRCLIALAEQSGHRVWIVLLDSRQRWWVAHHMFTAAFAAAQRSPSRLATTATSVAGT